MEIYMNKSESVVLDVNGLTMEDIERIVILYVYRSYNGNATKTAKHLDVSVRTIHSKLRKYRAEGYESAHRHSAITLPATKLTETV
jgi:DNA-binding NtrC family response regulator